MNQAHIVRCVTAAILLTAFSAAAAVDYWIAATEPGVVTSNDCGQIARLSGSPLIRRSFQAADEPGLPASNADRLGSGDELIAEGDARLELLAGANMLLAMGPGSRIRLGGMRSFFADGVPVTRLDLAMLAGEIRFQVRRNDERPEAILVSVGTLEILATRSDAELLVSDGWRCAVLSGEVMARVRRGGLPGAPFAIPAGSVLSAEGVSSLSGAEQEAIRIRVPFSFENTTAALPPLPPMSIDPEAP